MMNGFLHVKHQNQINVKLEQRIVKRRTIKREITFNYTLLFVLTHNFALLVSQTCNMSFISAEEINFTVFLRIKEFSAAYNL